jgi:mono/diheme cytochrome c family protein
MARTSAALILLWAVWTAPAPSAAAPPAALTYEQHVRPILKAKCFHCHGGEKVEAGLDLRLRRLLLAGGDSGPAITPGDPAASLLIERVAAGEMPPVDKKLTPAEVDVLRRWVAAGASTLRDEPAQLDPGVEITWEERAHWSFQPVRRPPLPAVANQEIQTPPDAFLLAALRAQELSFSPPADRRVLIQRLSFDLWGLPPTDEEVQAFISDSRPDAYERLVERYLASPRYGERWARHWLDVAGYADSDGFVDADTVRPYAYKYRDYVVRALNTDRPFDEFLVEQLAGDELLASPLDNLLPADVEKLVATGYLRMAADGSAADGIDHALVRNQVVADTIKIVTTSLLGLTVGCAQCHDHRYDPIPQVDYYRLRAVFEPALDWQKWRTPPQRLISLYTPADREAAARVEQEVALVGAMRRQKQAEFLAAALEKELAKFPEPLRAPLRVAQQTPAEQRSPEQQQLLAENPSVNVHPGVLYQYDQAAADELKKLDAQMAEMRTRKPPEDFVQALTEIPGQRPPTHRFHRGDHRQPQEIVAPGGLTVCSAPGSRLTISDHDPQRPSSGRRLAFARWIVGSENPLTARVLVNRVWMHHFGQGLVNTPSDFGTLGERPSHPELLDWLASEFVRGGWRLKPLHRMLVLSRAYQQSSARGLQSERDADNRLLARMSLRRLDAETIRDRMLAAAGLIEARLGGPAVPVQEDEAGQVVVASAAPPPGAPSAAGHEAFRRSLYVQVRRSKPLALLQTFDAPVMETNCDRRASSTVATQALLLINGQQVWQLAEHFAARVLRETGPDPVAQVERAWRLAYQRPPQEPEQRLAGEFLSRRAAGLAAQTPPAADPPRQALVSLCQALFASNEFLYVP